MTVANFEFSLWRASGLEPLLTSMILLNVISHLPWMNADLFKQAIISMASPLFTLLLTGMFGYVTGCLISLCLHRVSLRVTTSCTAGACLASNVKPGSLWNLTKASTGRGWKFTLIWSLWGSLLGRTGVGQGHQKPPFFLCSHSCRRNSKSVEVSVSYFFPLWFESWWYSTNLHFFHHISSCTSRVGHCWDLQWSQSCSFKPDTLAWGLFALPRSFLYFL